MTFWNENSNEIVEMIFKICDIISVSKSVRALSICGQKRAKF